MHRLLHALSQKFQQSDLDAARSTATDSWWYFEGDLAWSKGKTPSHKKLEANLYTFKSALTDNLGSSEDVIEIATQYLISGDVKLDFDKLKRFFKSELAAGNLKVKHFDHWFKRVKASYEHFVQAIKNDVDRLVKQAVKHGKVYYI